MPEGAFSEATEIQISVTDEFKPLPETAKGCGQMFDIQLAGFKQTGLGPQGTMPNRRFVDAMGLGRPPATCC